MPLFDRFRGRDDDNHEVDKLAIWHAITSFAELLDGELTDAELIQRFALSADEQTVFESIKAKAVADISGISNALVSIGLDAAIAMSVARSTVRDQFTHTMMRAEFGYDSRAEFNSEMGI